MGVATRTRHLDPRRAVGIVGGGRQRLLAQRSVKTGPAGARIEFGVAGEQLRAAADAAIHTFLLGVDVFSAERQLGLFLASYAVFLGRQEPLPLPIRFGDRLEVVVRLGVVGRGLLGCFAAGVVLGTGILGRRLAARRLPGLGEADDRQHAQHRKNEHVSRDT